MTTTTDKPSSDRVVVVGPVIVDHYYLGTTKRLDQTAPVPIVDVKPGESFLGFGGGANAANGLAHMAMPVAFVTAVGHDRAGQAYMNSPPNDLIDRYVTQEKEYQTPQKHRVYASGKLISRYDVDVMPKANVEDKIVDLFMRCVADVKPLAILVSDYAKGICTERSLEVIFRYARENSVKVIVDPVPAPEHMQQYHGAYILTPNVDEALAATRLENVNAAAAALCKELALSHCIVTRGAAGLLWVSPDKHPLEIPAIPAMVVDTCGAGDTVAAALTYGVAAGMPMSLTVGYAVTAGALAVETGGALPIPLFQIHRRACLVHGAGRKQVNEDFAVLLRLSTSIAGGRFGITNGIFDLLHPGHVSLLEQAASKCDLLAVLLNTDASATRIKRAPVHPAAIRVAALAAHKCVDAIIMFDEDTPEAIIKRLEPDLLMKGPEWAGKEEQIPGAAFVKSTGGSVEASSLEYDVHTTELRKAASDADDRETPDTPAQAADSSGGAADPTD